MKTTTKLFGLIAFVAITALSFTALSLTACDNGNPDTPPAAYTVRFDANGGTPQPPDQTVSAGGKASEPTGVTKGGYQLDGWYKESNLTTKWNFAADIVSADITLHAKWIDDPNAPRQQTATRELANGIGTVTITGYLTNDELIYAADTIASKFNSRVTTAKSYRVLFSRGITCIVEKDPDGYNERKTTGDGKTAYIAFDKVDAPNISDVLNALYNNRETVDGYLVTP